MPADFFSEIRDDKTPPTYNFFNGDSWVSSQSQQLKEIKSPIDNSLLGKIQVVTTAEIDKIMENAVLAQQSWAKVPLYKRVQIMHLAADWILHYEEYLTSLMVMEIGKSFKESKSEIKRTAELIDYFADEVISIRGETLDSDNFPGFEKGRIAMIERVPYGVVLAIAPFNYPVNLSASKIAPALLMGNSVIFKPPTQGAISGLHLCRIFEKAGVPKNVISCVTGGGSDIGDYLVSHPKTSMITFTGNSDTGDHIAKTAGMKPLLFECGGNNPAIVFPDADMNLTAKEIVKGAFSYSGQRCTAIKYVLATPGIIETLLPNVLSTLKEIIHMGDPRSPHTEGVGPVISEQVAIEIENAINEAQSQGAKIVTGGHRNQAYIEPTVLTEVKPGMKIVAQEIFGPVLSFISVNSNDEITQIIENSKYGLQACIFTQDEGAGIAFANSINVGTIQINGSPQRGPDHFPFLGIKGSGVGVQGVKYSLEAVSRLKPIVLNKPN